MSDDDVRRFLAGFPSETAWPEPDDEDDTAGCSIPCALGIHGDCRLYDKWACACDCHEGDDEAGIDPEGFDWE